MPTVDGCLRAYRVSARAEGKSPRTVQSVTEAVTYFKDFLGGDVEVASVTADHLRAFINALRLRRRWGRKDDKLLSPFTVNHYVLSIKSCWSWLRSEGYVQVNPLAGVKVKTPQTVVPALSRRELVAILEAINTGTVAGFRNYVILLTLLDTGARISEVLNATLDDLDLEEHSLKVMGKGNRQRLLPLGNQVVRLLAKWTTKSRPDTTEGYIFVTVRGARLIRDRLEKDLARYSMKAIGKRVHPHQLRHTMAVLWLRAGGDAFHLQKVMGHWSLSTTRIYVNLVDEDIRLAHAKHGVVDRLKL